MKNHLVRTKSTLKKNIYIIRFNFLCVILYKLFYYYSILIFTDKKSKMDSNGQDKIKCDSCGKGQEQQKFKFKKKSKRFCSQECLKMFENNSKTIQNDKKNGKNWVSISN